MNSYLLLLVEVSISVTVSFSVLFVLSASLTRVLQRICPDEQAAAFWLSYTKIILMIAPLLLVLAVDMFTNFNDPMDSLRLALIAALGGLLAALYFVGKRLGQFVTVPQLPGAAS